MGENKVVIECRITGNGGMPPDDRAIVQRALNQVRGKMVRVTIEQIHRNVSSPQLRYYNGTIVPLVHQYFKSHGVHTIREETHEYLKRHVGGLIDYSAPPDEEGQYPTRSFSPHSETCPDVNEMGVFFEQVWAWAAGIGLYIPSPKEPWENCPQ